MQLTSNLMLNIDSLQMLFNISDDDDCAEPYPCLNGGTCLDLINDFECMCAAGFSGTYCHISKGQFNIYATSCFYVVS